jgi:hypothetical protein
LSDRVAVGVDRGVDGGVSALACGWCAVSDGAGAAAHSAAAGRVVVYFVLAMCLFSGQGYEEVARLLTEGLAQLRGWRGSWRVPLTAAIWKARSRLGVEPVKELFTTVCHPVAHRTRWAASTAAGA